MSAGHLSGGSMNKESLAPRKAQATIGPSAKTEPLNPFIRVGNRLYRVPHRKKANRNMTSRLPASEPHDTHSSAYPRATGTGIIQAAKGSHTAALRNVGHFLSHDADSLDYTSLHPGHIPSLSRKSGSC